MQFFEAEKERIKQFYVVSLEGYSRNWDIHWDHVIGTPYFGSMHWHRGRMPQQFVASNITKLKKTLVAFAGQIRDFSGERLIFLLSSLDPEVWHAAKLCLSQRAKLVIAAKGARMEVA